MTCRCRPSQRVPHAAQSRFRDLWNRPPFCRAAVGSEPLQTFIPCLSLAGPATSPFILHNSLRVRRWLGAESNHRHRDFQSPALPTELPSPWPRSVGGEIAAKKRGWQGKSTGRDQGTPGTFHQGRCRKNRTQHGAATAGYSPVPPISATARRARDSIPFQSPVSRRDLGASQDPPTARISGEVV